MAFLTTYQLAVQQQCHPETIRRKLRYLLKKHGPLNEVGELIVNGEVVARRPLGSGNWRINDKIVSRELFL